ncbi:Transposon Ty3-G Gag-Pol poly [Brachionus plicatilis]|uniref:Transposon Ty3-G Gag-Pol poly n=1 Tax=Brachionus plicatilis TaxID=10195 RepID=A0A3M7T620_BRAPC|nr:Transposon Ty3-G Gag-Pol poly [Brachionus plicatilis]
MSDKEVELEAGCDIGSMQDVEVMSTNYELESELKSKIDISKLKISDKLTIAEQQDDDKEIAIVKASVKADVRDDDWESLKYKEFWNRSREKLKVKNGIFYKNVKEEWLILVPLHHDSITAGHLAFEKTLHAIGLRFTWPDMKANVYDYCNSCEKCQKFKVKNNSNTKPMVIIKVDKPWDLVGMDFAGPLKRTKLGNCHFVLGVDYFSKFCVVEAFKNALKRLKRIKNVILVYTRTRPGQVRSFEPKFIGPFKIIEQVNETNFRIKSLIGKKAESVVHFNRMHKYNSRESNELSEVNVTKQSCRSEASNLDEEIDQRLLIRACARKRLVQEETTINGPRTSLENIPPARVEIELDNWDKSLDNKLLEAQGVENKTNKIDESRLNSNINVSRIESSGDESGKEDSKKEEEKVREEVVDQEGEVVVREELIPLPDEKGNFMCVIEGCNNSFNSVFGLKIHVGRRHKGLKMIERGIVPQKENINERQEEQNISVREEVPMEIGRGGLKYIFLKLLVNKIFESLSTLNYYPRTPVQTTTADMVIEIVIEKNGDWSNH